MGMGEAGAGEVRSWSAKCSPGEGADSVVEFCGGVAGSA